MLVAERALALVRVVEGDGHGGLGHAGLAVLVHQFLQVGGADLIRGGKEDELENGDHNKDIGHF